MINILTSAIVFTVYMIAISLVSQAVGVPKLELIVAALLFREILNT